MSREDKIKQLYLSNDKIIASDKVNKLYLMQGYQLKRIRELKQRRHLLDEQIAEHSLKLNLITKEINKI